MRKHLRIGFAGLIVICGLTGTECLAKEDETSGFDRAWRYMTIYENQENFFIQKFTLSGRAQIDSVWVNPETPDNAEKYNDTLWRRFRFGFKANLFENWTAHLEANFNLNEPMGDWYTVLTDAYLSWSPNENLKFNVLKQSAGFTLDGMTSSKKLLTLERNNLTHNLWFTREYFNGILANGNVADKWSYKASFFSSDGDPEWGWDGASWFTFWSLGYKLGNTKMNVAYVYQDEHEEAATRPFEQILSLTVQWQYGPWGIWGDLSGGKGFSDQNQSDVWGLVVMPFYEIGQRTQMVLRYTYLNSQGNNGLRLNRYENEVIDHRGDTYNEVYGGFNVYFYGHKFKWQAGLTWADMADDAMDGGEYEGLALSTGLRVYW